MKLVIQMSLFVYTTKSQYNVLLACICNCTCVKYLGFLSNIYVPSNLRQNCLSTWAASAILESLYLYGHLISKHPVPWQTHFIIPSGDAPRNAFSWQTTNPEFLHLKVVCCACITEIYLLRAAISLLRPNTTALFLWRSKHWKPSIRLVRYLWQVSGLRTRTYSNKSLCASYSAFPMFVPKWTYRLTSGLLL